jgi:hypothetical protein
MTTSSFNLLVDMLPIKEKEPVNFASMAGHYQNKLTKNAKPNT